MPKTVLIILAAVVALIVIVVLTGMRYLRADDEDDFDDVPAEHGRSRGRASHLPPEQGRQRRHQDDDRPSERHRERPSAVPAGARPGGAGRNIDRDVASRAGGGRTVSDRAMSDRPRREDTSWREDGGATARQPLPHRESREERPASRAGRISGRDSSAADYDRDLADGRDGRDPRAGRDLRDERDHRDSRDARDSRGSRDSRDARDSRDSRDARDRRDSAPAADLEDRARRSTTRPGSGPDSRKNGAAQEREDLLPAVKPRQGRGKRDADGDWPSNEWDELSDVDYWAELASDRPLTTALPGEPSARSRRGESGRGESGRGESRSDPAASRSRRDRGPGPSQSDRDRPVRDADRGPGHSLVPAVKRQPDLAAAELSEDLSGTGSRRAAALGRADLGRTERLHAVPSGAGAAGPGPASAAVTSKGLTNTGGRTSTGPDHDSRHLMPDPDDPLTSPSFPRIADDSRSYRRSSRSAPPDELAGRGAEDALHRSAQSGAQGRSREADLPLPPAPLPPAPLPPVNPIRGIDDLSQPHSYPRPTGSGSDYAAASADYTRPTANPYRSVPSSSPVSGGYPVPAAVSAGGYEARTTEYSVPVRPVPAAPVGYPDSRGPGQAGYQSPGGYPAPAGAGPSQYQGPSGAHPAAYPPAGPPSGGYSGDSYSTDTVARGGYQPSALDSGYHDPAYPNPGYHDPGYQVPAADRGGYQPARPAPSALPEPGFGGYPATAATSSYASPADTAGYGPGQAGLPGGYSDYAGSGPASGSHALPDPGYLPGGYAPAPAEPGFHGSLPAGQAESGYPAYPAPVPAVHGSPYPEPSGQLPGLPAGYQEPTYLPGPYDPVGYTVPAPQPGYAGADPYAVDPYGYPANGGGGH